MTHIEGSLLEGITALVVDDDADSRDLVAAALQNGGASTILAASAAEAIGHLSCERFDVLVTDIAMPDEDGCSLLRDVNAIASIPAIALTSLAGDEDRRRVLAAGFRLHLAKPADARSLARAVATVVHRTET